MSSRLTRTLLKLYPRRMRDRYGAELLDLQDELRAKGDISRVRLIADMLAAALLTRPARRAYLMIGALLVIGALVVAGTVIGRRAAHSAASVTANPYGTCFVAGGSSCSPIPCSQFTGRPSAEGAVIYGSLPATRSRPRATTRCARYPRVRPQRPVFVGE